MSYKIIYGKAPKYNVTKRILRIQFITGIFFLLFTVCVKLLWPEGTEYLRQVFVGEELSNGANAVMALVDSMQSWEDVADTVAVFCQELVDGR